MIYVGKAQKVPNKLAKNAKRKYLFVCYLWADTEAELDSCAAQLRLKAEWKRSGFGYLAPVFPHFQITTRRRAAAIRIGACEAYLENHLRKAERSGNK